MRGSRRPFAVLYALERLANGSDYDCRSIRAEIGVKHGQLKDLEARLGRTFQHAAYKDELEGVRDHLRLALSEHPPEGLPPVSELAEKIKGLREANTVEATPERAVRKAVRAERPVTARIRERLTQEVPQVKEPAEVHTVLPAPVEEPPAAPPAAVIAMPEPVKPVIGYAKSVERLSEQKAAQLRLF